MKKFTYSTKQDSTGTYLLVNDKKNNGVVLKINYEAQLRTDLNDMLLVLLQDVAEKMRLQFQTMVDQS